MEEKVGSPSSFGGKRPFISLNSSASTENLLSSQCARARARANHAHIARSREHGVIPGKRL